MPIDFATAMSGPAPSMPLAVDTDYSPGVKTPPAPVNPYDLAPVKDALAPLAAQIDDMASQANAVKIIDADSQTLAVEMAGQAKKLNKAIEAARKEFIAAPNEYVSSVNGLSKSFQSKLEAIEKGLKFKIGGYQQRLEMERRKAEQKAREEAEKLQKQINSEAKAAHVEPVKVEAPVIPEAPKCVRTAAGTAGMKKVWKFEVTDAQAVPRPYLVVDESAIRRDVAAGVRIIEGVRIYEENQVAIRA